MSSPLGLKIVKARSQRGWTRAELARRANIPYSSLKHLEHVSRDITQPATRAQTSETYLHRLAAALELDYDELRILAGYAIRPSENSEQARERIEAQIRAFPRLERSLRTILTKGDASVIDQVSSYLEFIASRRE